MTFKSVVVMQTKTLDLTKTKIRSNGHEVCDLEENLPTEENV